MSLFWQNPNEMRKDFQAGKKLPSVLAVPRDVSLSLDFKAGD